MDISFIFFYEFLCISIPLCCTSDNIIKGFWITFWVFINSYFMFNPSAPDLSIILNEYQNLSFALCIIWQWILLPLIENIMAIIICTTCCLRIYEIFNRIKCRNARYRKGLPLIRHFPPLEDCFTIFFLVGLEICIEYALIWLHGYYPFILSVIFTSAYGYVLGALLLYLTVYDIHKCSNYKLMTLNLSSIIFGIYVFRYIFNF